MEDARAVGGYAAAVVGGGSVPVGVRRYEAGERHAVWAVTFADGSMVVVRVGGGCEAASREAAVLRVVPGRGLAPRVLDVRCSSEWFGDDVPVMCVSHVEGEARDLSAVGSDGLEALGRVVAEVHAAPTGELASWFPGPSSLGEYRVAYEELVEAKLGWARPPLARELRDRLHEAWRRMDRSTASSDGEGGGLVLTHGDLGPGNILWPPRQRPVLIDWEYARLADPADDIAYLFGQHDLTPSQRAAFWRGYEPDAAPDAVVERVRRWEPLNLLGSTLWWIERATRSLEAGDTGAAAAVRYRDEAVRRLERVERLQRRT